MTSGPSEEQPHAEAPGGGSDPGAPGHTEVNSDLGSDPVDPDLDVLADVRRERDEYLELAQRARADFENFRKRAARDTADAERRARVAFARSVVPVIDNLERALGAADDNDPLRHGVELVCRDLLAAFNEAGVEAYDPDGERFDPSLHEALSTRAAAEGEPGTVIETVERGYRLDGQVIRPARVVVAE